MPYRVLGVRRFSMEDQHRFATLSGDFNPLHVDVTAARRTMFGQPVVHGIHAVLWAVERYLADAETRGHGVRSFRRLSVSFPKPIFPGDRVVARVADEGDASRIQVTDGTTVLVDVTWHGPALTARSWPDAVAASLSDVPAVRAVADLTGLAGRVPLGYDGRALRQDFRASCAGLGAGVVARLMALSRLVGMECPGLHSLFSSFELTLTDAHDTGDLEFRVERVDPRFSGVQIGLGGTGITGTIKAFVRPEPARQASIETVAGAVTPGEFAGQQALIVGGSRGLGEVLAKVVACGGGHPAITYLHGAADARRVADEIRGWGGHCEVARLDVARPRPAILGLARAAWSPTHLYYFATPRIFVRRRGTFDDRVFRSFLGAYVQGFTRTYDACRSVGRGPLRVFYPSTVAIDEPVAELTEYATAKAAGEVAARQIERFGSDSRVLIERLPRIQTDQTATLLRAATSDALETMSRVARKMQTL